MIHVQLIRNSESTNGVFQDLLEIIGGILKEEPGAHDHTRMVIWKAHDYGKDNKDIKIWLL